MLRPPAKPPSRRRVIIALSIAAIGIVGIGILSWRDMTTPIPEFDDLRIVSSGGMRYEMSCRQASCTIEFRDKAGLRYQTPYLPRAQCESLVSQIKTRELKLHYGEWDTALKSDKIFTIYHIQDGPAVLLDYEERAAAAAKEKSAAIWIILLTLALVAAAGYLGVVFGLKARKR